MAVLTTSDLKTYYGFAFPAAQDAMYERMIAAAERACLEYLGMDSFETQAIVQYFDCVKGQGRYVLSAPVSSVTGVWLDIGRSFDAALAPADYMVDMKTGVLTLYDPAKADGVLALKVSYSVGWAAVPDDVRYCVAMTVQYMAKVSQTSQSGVVSRSTDGGTESMDQNVVPLPVQKHLAKYRMQVAR